MPCREGDLLRSVLRAKGSLNLQIKQWAEGVSDGLFLNEEFADSFPWLPDWVWDVVLNQAKKRIMDKTLDRMEKQTAERLRGL